MESDLEGERMAIEHYQKAKLPWLLPNAGVAG